jgi:hypothetical protein
MKRSGGALDILSRQAMPIVAAAFRGKDEKIRVKKMKFNGQLNLKKFF